MSLYTIICTIISQYTSNITSINIYIMKFPRSNLHIFRRNFSWRKHPFSPTSAGAAGAAGLGFLFLRRHGRPAQRPGWCGSGCGAAAAQRRSAGNDLGSTQGFLGTFWDGFLVEITVWFVLGLFVMLDGFLVKTLDFSLDFWVDVDSLVILLKNLVELVWFI